MNEPECGLKKREKKKGYAMFKVQVGVRAGILKI